VTAIELRATERTSGVVLESLETSSDWYVEGVGWVASHYESKTWQDGVVVDDTGPVDAWLVEGVVGGAPVQLPPP
jgi:ribosomal protein L24